jgi:hypothetical protein
MFHGHDVHLIEETVAESQHSRKYCTTSWLKTFCGLKTFGDSKLKQVRSQSSSRSFVAHVQTDWVTSSSPITEILALMMPTMTKTRRRVLCLRLKLATLTFLVYCSSLRAEQMLKKPELQAGKSLENISDRRSLICITTKP